MRRGRLTASESVNWNWPGAISLELPKMVQLSRSSDRFVLAKMVNAAPGVLVKLRLNLPSGSLKGARTIGADAGETSRMTEELGVPFTNTVSSAWPGGKLVTGSEINEFVCQLVAER